MTDFEYYVVAQSISDGSSSMEDHKSVVNMMMDDILDDASFSVDRNETMYFDSYEDHFSPMSGHYQTDAVGATDTSVLRYLKDQGTKIHELISDDVKKRLVLDVAKSYDEYSNTIDMDKLEKTDSFSDALQEIKISIDEAVSENHSLYNM